MTNFTSNNGILLMDGVPVDNVARIESMSSSGDTILVRVSLESGDVINGKMSYAGFLSVSNKINKPQGNRFKMYLNEVKSNAKAVGERNAFGISSAIKKGCGCSG